MATDKSTRQAAPKVIENYVVSIKKLFGEPKSVHDSAFLKGKYITDGTNLATAASNEEAFSIVEPIGFNVEINGKVYKEFSVAMAGWIFLRDPDGGSTNPSNFWTDILNAFTSIHDNDAISAAFSYNHIFLPIWFDRNHSIASSVAALQAADYSTKFSSNNLANNITFGTDTRYWPYDAEDYGVRYVNIYDSKKGKCLLVRWTVSQQYYGNRLKFEIALFENGTIEYRYWPIKTFEASDTTPAAASSATVGVWWHEAGKQYLYRDFSALLDYKKDQRTLHELGGAVYDGIFTDSSQYYANNVGATNWPKNGAVITFSPPTRHLKVLPRKMSSLIGTNKPAVPSTGLFDDRKTVNFKKNVQIHLPSGEHSRLAGDSSDIDIPSRQLLFTSGSIIVTGNVTKSNIDKNLEQLSLLDTQKKDLSFNESKFNNLTATTSAFYATGSSLEVFGQGFTTPLKSKTQFTYSLPVTKQTTMLESTASMYYYSKENKNWTLACPTGSLKQGVLNNSDSKLYGKEVYSHPYLRNGIELEYGNFSFKAFQITENSVFFNAIGNKTISGSNSTSANFLQTDRNIGLIFNKNIGEVAPAFVPFFRLADKDLTVKQYPETITDSPTFYPKNDQLIPLKIDYPFLIEKVVVDIPLYINGGWFDDRTTCNKAFGIGGTADGYTSGAIDFGGPGLTFGLFCPKRVLNNTYMDLIASGTITNIGDNISDVLLYKDSGMLHHVLRPIGFKSFSNPTVVLSGTNNIFEGSARLELAASVAGGLTIARNDRSLMDPDPTDTFNYEIANKSTRNNVISLLTSEYIFPNSGRSFNTYDLSYSGTSEYELRAPRVLVQQISPLSRGKTGLEFNGASILGGVIPSYNENRAIKNPLYYAQSGSISSELKSKIDSSRFICDSMMVYSLVQSQPSPYLIMPGESIVISMSKTRPVTYSMTGTDSIFGAFNVTSYKSFILTGSHGTVMLNTGSINVTIYGSYVKEGMEYHE